MGFKGLIMRGLYLYLVLTVTFLWVTQTKAQSSGSSCNSTIASMASCLSYVTGNSSNPSAVCCSQLSAAVQSSPQCLCSILNGNGGALFLTINRTLALSLPGACKVRTPPISQCKVGGPTTAPTVPPSSPTTSPTADSSNGTPEGEAPVTPSASEVPSGSKSVPSTEGGSSDGSILKVPCNLLWLLLFFMNVLPDLY